MQVNNETELFNALTNRESDIVIGDSFDITMEILIDYKVNISSTNNITLTRANNNASILLNITQTGDLVLSNIVLDGTSCNALFVPMIVNNNKLELNNVTIANALSTTSGSGLFCGETAISTIIKNSNFKNCISSKNGGAIYHSGESRIFMDNVSFIGNESNLGGGICCYQPSNHCLVEINKCNFSQNKATSGGAIYLDSNCDLNIIGDNIFTNNEAETGKDIYDKGIIRMLGRNDILSGLYIYDENNYINLFDTIANSNIFIEESDYVSPIPENSPIMIARTTGYYPLISNEDLSAFRKPVPNFREWGFQIGDDFAFIELATGVHHEYTITYTNLNGASNSNPLSYTENDVPIILQDPVLDGHEFLGWLNENNEPITEISSSSTGNRVIKATWQNAVFEISFNGNSTTPVSNLPSSIMVDYGESAILPDNIPKRNCYLFLNWNTEPNGTGTTYYPKETITDVRNNIVLYAIWHKIPIKCILVPTTYCCVCNKCCRRVCKCCCSRKC